MVVGVVVVVGTRLLRRWGGRFGARRLREVPPVAEILVKAGFGLFGFDHEPLVESAPRGGLIFRAAFQRHVAEKRAGFPAQIPGWISRPGIRQSNGVLISGAVCRCRI